MSDTNTAAVERYRNSFLKEVEASVEQGEWVKMCIHCGMCSGSCPLGDAWEHPPQKIFTMICAGKRDEVLGSSSMWMCTSCYSCIVRCPRELPVTHIMHGLAHYAKRLGIAPKEQPTAKFAQLFWDNLMKKGRINELRLGVDLYFKVGEGLRTALQHKDIGLAMWKAKRMNPMQFFGGHGIKDLAGFKKMIAKAKELEAKRLDRHGA